jgi:hypothetical protein
MSELPVSNSVESSVDGSQSSSESSLGGAKQQKLDRAITNLSNRLGIPESKIREFLDSKEGDDLQLVRSMNNTLNVEVDFANDVETFANEHPDALLNLLSSPSDMATFTGALDQLNTLYSSLGMPPVTAGEMLYAFGGDVGKFSAYVEQLVALQNQFPDLVTREFIDGRIAYNSEALASVDAMMQSFQQVENQFGEENVDFMVFTLAFQGDAAKYGEYLTAKQDLLAAYDGEMLTEAEWNQTRADSGFDQLGLAQTYGDYQQQYHENRPTSEDIDGWLLKETNLSSSGEGTSAAPISVDECIAKMKELSVRTGDVGGPIKTMSQLGVAVGSPYSLITHLEVGTEQYQQQLSSSVSNYQLLGDLEADAHAIADKQELVTQLQKDIEAYHSLAQTQKTASSNDAQGETDEMRALREKIATNIILFYGEGRYTPEQVAGMSFDEKIAIASNQSNESPPGFGFTALRLQNSDGDNRYSKDEWELNIQGMLGVLDLTKNESSTLMNYLQKALQDVQKVFAMIEQQQKAMAELANQFG